MTFVDEQTVRPPDVDGVSDVQVVQMVGHLAALWKFRVYIGRINLQTVISNRTHGHNKHNNMALSTNTKLSR